MTIQDHIEGWCAIEDYLNADRKTIRKRGFPIYYYSTGRVYAFRSELDGHRFPHTPSNSPILPHTPVSPGD